MTSCVTVCPLEAQPSEGSPGTVSDDELLVRVAWMSHFKKGVLKNSFIKNDDLLQGQLSVWRRNLIAESSPEDVADVLIAKSNGRTDLHSVLAASAADIRAIHLDGARALCVVDDMDTGAGPDPAHAVIKMCDRFAGIENDAPEFLQIRTELQHLLKQGVFVQRAA